MSKSIVFSRRSTTGSHARPHWRRVGSLLLGTLLSQSALAQTAFGDAESKVTSFFGSINSLLNVASIAVVTIAVIFAGYQIAFAHKRISDVAPVLVGGFLIGAAAQIAKMLMGDNSTLQTGLLFVSQALPYA